MPIFVKKKMAKICAKNYFNTLKIFWVHPNLFGNFLAITAKPRGKNRAQSEVFSVKIERAMPV